MAEQTKCVWNGRTYDKPGRVSDPYHFTSGQWANRETASCCITVSVMLFFPRNSYCQSLVITPLNAVKGSAAATDIAHTCFNTVVKRQAPPTVAFEQNMRKRWLLLVTMVRPISTPSWQDHALAETFTRRKNKTTTTTTKQQLRGKDFAASCYIG